MGTSVGVLHPGAMGASVAGCARASGARTVWASQGRSEATAERARAAGLEDVGSLDALVATAEVILSVCPPAEAEAVAGDVMRRGFGGTFVDANAIAPATARAIGAAVTGGGATFVDGGIVGPPARGPSTTVLYLSGDGDAPPRVAGLFDGTHLEAQVLEGGAGTASAMKMAYAAYTKGHTALLLSVRALARAQGVETPLLAHWARTHRDLASISELSAKVAGPKGWRFAGEMHEIATTYGDAGLPRGFFEGAEQLYRRLAPLKGRHAPTLDEVLKTLSSTSE